VCFWEKNFENSGRRVDEVGFTGRKLIINS